jgi:hypothetical protein
MKTSSGAFRFLDLGLTDTMSRASPRALSKGTFGGPSRSTGGAKVMNGEGRGIGNIWALGGAFTGLHAEDGEALRAAVAGEAREKRRPEKKERQSPAFQIA